MRNTKKSKSKYEPKSEPKSKPKSRNVVRLSQEDVRELLELGRLHDAVSTHGDPVSAPTEFTFEVISKESVRLDLKNSVREYTIILRSATACIKRVRKGLTVEAEDLTLAVRNMVEQLENNTRTLRDHASYIKSILQELEEISESPEEDQ